MLEKGSGSKGSPAILTIRRCTGVTSEGHLRSIDLSAQATKYLGERIHPSFGT